MTLTERVEAALSKAIDQDLMNQARELYGTSYTANQPSTTTILYTLLVEQKSLLDTIKANRARIAILEKALALPEGADPWDLERAKVEGARDRAGRTYSFANDNSMGSVFICDHAEFSTVVDSSGNHIGAGLRLYCIKKGSQ